MQKINVLSTLNISYPILFDEDIFSPDNNILLTGRNQGSRNCIIIMDQTVHDLFKQKILHYFHRKNIIPNLILVKGGDENKNIQQFHAIFEQLNEYPVNRRNEPVIIIGGGVTTDIGGFATSCFRRGIPHIKVPTTLMGYVDASVGVKTGINYHSYKNRMGSFYPPLAVILDKSFLKTLPKRELSNGVGEIIKIAVIKNQELFLLLEKNAANLMQSKFQNNHADTVLKQSIADMVEELEPNLFEDDLERVVDFGHTFSLIFEMESTSEVKHGEAVAMDILISCLLAYRRGLMSLDEYQRVQAVIDAFEINIRYQLYNPDLLWSSLNERVLHRDGLQRTPIPTGIGSATFINDIRYEEIQALCHELQQLKTPVLDQQ
jgi:3-dehydroquinate synthetase